MDFSNQYRRLLSVAATCVITFTALSNNVAATTQPNPGWALDRIDGLLDFSYKYNKTGAGQTIYVLDSGLNLNNPLVKSEFTNLNTGLVRATNFYDFNYPNEPFGGNSGNTSYGSPCSNHGTNVAAIAAGNTYGVAKDATIRMIKVADLDCGNKPEWVKTALDWLDVNANAGDIINLSLSMYTVSNCTYSKAEDRDKFEAIESVLNGLRNKGVIIVKSAGNDGCDPSALPVYRSNSAFVVGGTWAHRLSGSTSAGGPLSQSVIGWLSNYVTLEGWDEVAYKIEDINASGIDLGELELNIGAAIDAYVPGVNIKTMSQDGLAMNVTGTSFATPVVAGIFAVACEANPVECKDPAHYGNSYNILKSTGQKGNVVTKNIEILNDNSDNAVFLIQHW